MCVLSIDPRDAIHTVLYSARAAPMLAGSDANSPTHTLSFRATTHCAPWLCFVSQSGGFRMFASGGALDDQRLRQQSGEPGDDFFGQTITPSYSMANLSPRP